MGETKVDETIPNETKPKKLVGRSVAVALGIVCILLIAGLGGAMAYYSARCLFTGSQNVYFPIAARAYV